MSKKRQTKRLSKKRNRGNTPTPIKEDDSFIDSIVDTELFNDMDDSNILEKIKNFRDNKVGGLVSNASGNSTIGKHLGTNVAKQIYVCFLIMLPKIVNKIRNYKYVGLGTLRRIIVETFRELNMSLSSVIGLNFGFFNVIFLLVGIADAVWKSVLDSIFTEKSDYDYEYYKRGRIDVKYILPIMTAASISIVIYNILFKSDIIMKPDTEIGSSETLLQYRDYHEYPKKGSVNSPIYFMHKKLVYDIKSGKAMKYWDDYNEQGKSSFKEGIKKYIKYFHTEKRKITYLYHKDEGYDGAINPGGLTGIIGRGLLPMYGPNYILFFTLKINGPLFYSYKKFKPYKILTYDDYLINDNVSYDCEEIIKKIGVRMKNMTDPFNFLSNTLTEEQNEEKDSISQDLKFMLKGSGDDSLEVNYVENYFLDNKYNTDWAWYHIVHVSVYANLDDTPGENFEKIGDDTAYIFHRVRSVKEIAKEINNLD